MRISDWSSDVCSSDLPELFNDAWSGRRHEDQAVDGCDARIKGIMQPEDASQRMAHNGQFRGIRNCSQLLLQLRNPHHAIGLFLGGELRIKHRFSAATKPLRKIRLPMIRSGSVHAV